VLLYLSSRPHRLAARTWPSQGQNTGSIPVGAIPVESIIADPLFRFVRVRDGNDYAAVTNALEPLHALARESGAYVLAVHHLGKGD
jgi:AAA domain